jgi:hypothetical protein
MSDSLPPVLISFPDGRSLHSRQAKNSNGYGLNVSRHLVSCTSSIVLCHRNRCGGAREIRTRQSDCSHGTSDNSCRCDHSSIPSYHLETTPLDQEKIDLRLRCQNTCTADVGWICNDDAVSRVMCCGPDRRASKDRRIPCSEKPLKVL